MNLSLELLSMVITIVSTLIVGGWTILKMITKNSQDRQEALATLIEERFEFAEKQRQSSSGYWERLFHELQRREEKLSARLAVLEQHFALHQMKEHRNET